LPWQRVTPDVGQPVPIVVPTGRQRQAAEPSAPWQVCEPRQAVGVPAMWQLPPSCVFVHVFTDVVLVQ
jgi:hypothetical protein